MASRMVALWRAVNVGGRNRVAMADLRALLVDLRVTDPRTLLQSGNAVFSSTSRPAALASRIEDEGRRRLALDAAVVVRTAADWRAIVAGNPFDKEAAADPGHLVVMCLKAGADKNAGATLVRAVKGREVVHVAGEHLYLFYPDGIGRSTLTPTIIERALGTVGTGRNWNTVLKLRTLLEDAP